MKEPEKELIRNHPYFVKEMGTAFRLKKDNQIYEIYFDCELEDVYPIKWQNSSAFPLTIWGAEEWFQKLFCEVNELFFQRNRVRMITKDIRRDIKNVVHLTCIGEKKGKEFVVALDNMLQAVQDNERMEIGEEFSSLMEVVKEKLEKAGYKVTIIKEDDMIVSVTIC